MAKKMSTYQTQLKQNKKRKHGINKNKEMTKQNETDKVVRFDLAVALLSHPLKDTFIFRHTEHTLHR